MKNIYLILMLFIIVSCVNDDDENKGSCEPDQPIDKIIFAIDKSSDEYQLFLDKEEKMKKNIGIIVGENKFLFDEIIEEVPTVYFKTLSDIEENTIFLGLTTKGTSVGNTPGWYILDYALEEIGKPFYITIDDDKKFELIITKKPIGTKKYGEVIVNTDITVNGKETKFLFARFQPIIVLK